MTSDPLGVLSFALGLGGQHGANTPCTIHKSEQWDIRKYFSANTTLQS